MLTGPTRCFAKLAQGFRLNVTTLTEEFWRALPAAQRLKDTERLSNADAWKKAVNTRPKGTLLSTLRTCLKKYLGLAPGTTGLERKFSKQSWMSGKRDGSQFNKSATRKRSLHWIIAQSKKTKLSEWQESFGPANLEAPG